MALRGGRGRGETSDDRHSTSDDAEDADINLSSAARSQLQLVMRTINSSSEVIEANRAAREVPEALARSSAAAFAALRAAPAIFGRMMQAARMSQDQLRVLCQRLGFHPAVAGALYYSLQVTSGSAAVFALGFAIFALQAVAGGLALVLSVLGGVGSTLLLGGAAGTAVVGGSVVVPAFVLSSGTAVLVFIAGVVTRRDRRGRRFGSRRTPRELPPRIYELPDPASNEQVHDDPREGDRWAVDSTRSHRHRRTASRDDRERAPGARASRQERSEERREAKESRSRSKSSAAARTAASSSLPSPAVEAAQPSPAAQSPAAQSRAASGAVGAEERRARPSESAPLDIMRANSSLAVTESLRTDVAPAHPVEQSDVHEVPLSTHPAQRLSAAPPLQLNPPTPEANPTPPQNQQSSPGATPPRTPPRPRVGAAGTPPSGETIGDSSDGVGARAARGLSTEPGQAGGSNAQGVASAVAQAGAGVNSTARGLRLGDVSASRDLHASLSQESREALKSGKAFLL